MGTATLGDLPLNGTDEFGAEWSFDNLTGWGVPASTVSFTQKARRSGAYSSEAFSKNREVAINGTIIAPDTATASGALDRLYAAVTLGPTKLTVNDGQGDRWTMVKQSSDVIPSWLNTFTVQYSIQVASDDWRKFGGAISGDTSLPSSSGGLMITGGYSEAAALYTAGQLAASANADGLIVAPDSEGYYDLFNADGTPASSQLLDLVSTGGDGLTVPFSIDAVLVTGQVSLTNPGNESGRVTLRIDGPCIGPIITHVNTGAVLSFSPQLVLHAGEFLLVDMEAQTALVNGTASRNGYVTSRGWSAFLPGQNTWAFTAASYSADSHLTVTATPAWR